MSDIAVRVALPEDHAFLAACMGGLQEAEIEVEANRSSVDESAEPHLNWVLEQVAAKDGAVFVAEFQGQRVGCLMCTIDEDNGEYVKPQHRGYGYVNDLYVGQKARGIGVADALMQAAEDYFREKGVTNIRLGVLSENKRARSFYERLGWHSYEQVYRKNL
jgi:ribosomal protein S18 acetylase RimI-like enzyme